MATVLELGTPLLFARRLVQKRFPEARERDSPELGSSEKTPPNTLCRMRPDPQRPLTTVVIGGLFPRPS